MQNNNYFKKNLEQLDKELKNKLNSINELREFSYTIGSDVLDINIIKKRNLKSIYKNPLIELQESLKYFQNFSHYPLMLFYGLGNGIFYKALLQNKKHKQIVVFEGELEIIFLILHLVDFSQELEEKRLKIIYSKDFNYVLADQIFSSNRFYLFVKTYNLYHHCDFYKTYKEDINKINSYNMQAIKNISLRKGNDPKDAMQGIEQFVYNIPKMINQPSYKELLKKRLGSKQTAIIVGTGPSLTKQLPLLKKYHDKAIIFCADSAYNILEREKIKPDYVCMLERDEIVAECFNNDFKNFDKDILFLCASLMHKKTINYLEKNKRNYLLITRAQPFALSLKLDEFGYIGGGMSVSHMMYEIACHMKFENIVLIGQDLAYGEDGISHSKGFIHAGYHDGHYQRDFGKYTTTAYGGVGKVESSEVWTLFRQIFENYIFHIKTNKTYNCTEGGARIKGTIEKPFKEICDNLLTTKIKKPLKKAHKLTRKDQNLLLLKAYKNIKKNIVLSEQLTKKCKILFKQISEQKKQKHTLEELVIKIDSFKEMLEYPKYNFIQEILGPTLYHEESLLAPIFVQDIKNESERQNKILAWIYAHRSLIESILDLILVLNQRLKKDIVPLRDLLERRKLI